MYYLCVCTYTHICHIHLCIRQQFFSWGFKSSAMWCWVIGCLAPDTLNDYSASIFRVKQYNNFFSSWTARPLKVDALHSLKRLGAIHPSPIPEDLNPQPQCYDNLISHYIFPIHHLKNRRVIVYWHTKLNWFHIYIFLKTEDCEGLVGCLIFK